MLAQLASLLAASASAPAPALQTSMPWWERITVTVDDKGAQQSCLYETSASPNAAAACDKEVAGSIKADGAGVTGLYKKVTFERRFSPGPALRP